MNFRFRFHLSERLQVTLILLAAIGGCIAIWYFLLLPQSRMREETAALRRQLENSPFSHYSPHALRQALEAERATLACRSQAWLQITERLATFANQAALRRGDFARIDYKNELFLTRRRLVEKSEALGIQLVATDLGIDDALTDRDAIRERMLQLKAVEKLADLTLDRRIERLVAIEPLPPVTHKGPDGKIVFDEYPVKVACDISFDNLYALFQSVFEENRAFAFRNIRIASGHKPDAPVRVEAIMSAMVFE
jgi:hypothetical protein